jgi:hypothetical protein
VADLALFVGSALLVRKREEQARRAMEEQETVAEEMGHPLNNLFAVTEGMIRGSARSAEGPAAMAEALSGRLHALASAHSLVRRKVNDSGIIPDEKDLGDLVRAVLSPKRSGHAASWALWSEKANAPASAWGPPKALGWPCYRPDAGKAGLPRNALRPPHIGLITLPLPQASRDRETFALPLAGMGDSHGPRTTTCRGWRRP